MEGQQPLKLKQCWSLAIIRENLPLGRKLWPSPDVSRWVSLAIGALGMATSASCASFSAWQNAMRAILNQTETQSNLMAQLTGIGSVVAFPAGFIYERFGSQADALAGGFLSWLTFTILWLATSSFKTFFANNQWLICLVAFFNGFASSFTYMGALMANVHNFPLKHRGKIIGTLDGVLSLGPALLSVIYNTQFTNGHIEPGEEAQQSLPNFLLLLASFYAVVSIFLFLFTGRLSEEDPDDEKTKLIIPVKPSSEEHPPDIYSEYPFQEFSFTKILFKWNFYFFMLQLSLSSSAQAVFQNNIATYLRSFSLNRFNMAFTVTNTCLQACSKIASGFISDAIAQRGTAPRAVVFLVPYALQTLALFVCIFHGENFTVLLLTCIFVGIGFGATWCQSATVLGELFGSKYLASNWGWSMLFAGIIGIPCSVGFGAIYDAAAEPNDIYCYGMACFKWSFALLAGTSLCSFIMALGLAQNMLQNAAFRRMMDNSQQ